MGQQAVIPRVIPIRRVDCSSLEVDCPMCGATHYVPMALIRKDGRVRVKCTMDRHSKPRVKWNYLRLMTCVDAEEDGLC